MQRVLVVDDHPDCAEVICLMLEWLGHVCRCESTAEGALALVRSWTPDMILLDVDLPDLSGFDVARQIVAAGSRRPYLVAVTGWSGFAHRQRSFAAGFDGHLVKPLDIAKLRAIGARTQQRIP